jgi:hypothetical protein
MASQAGKFPFLFRAACPACGHSQIDIKRGYAISVKRPTSLEIGIRRTGPPKT